MEMNLIPSFILREAGLELQDVPKIHVKDPNVDYHSIYVSAINLKIPLLLHGIFSYFVTKIPTDSEIEDAGCDVFFFTPDSPSWDHHNDEYTENENSYLD